MKLEVDYPLLAMKWAWFALRAQDYEWAEREIKQAIRMMEGGDEHRGRDLPGIRPE